MSDRRADLAAEAAFDMDLTADRRDVAEVYLGCKGIVSFVLSCSGGEWGGPVGRALHSSEGAVISSPAWSLMRALSALQDAAGRNALDGLGPATVPPEDENCSTPWRETSIRPRTWKNRTRWLTGDRTTRVRF